MREKEFERCNMNKMGKMKNDLTSDRHALVIGGSGMLAQASLWLAKQGYVVSVVGRNVNKLERLTRQHERLIPMSVNMFHFDKFREKIRDSIAERGAYDCVVAWIHYDEEKVLQIVVDEMKRVTEKKWDVFHVLGSSDNLNELMKQIRNDDIYNYYQVQLGFIIENSYSRWLTHDEIANGVIEAIKNKRPQTIVGTLTPWDQRP